VTISPAVPVADRAAVRLVRCDRTLGTEFVKAMTEAATAWQA
jgi:hypothetical protein